MKKLYTLLMATCVSMGSYAQLAIPKLSPATRLLLKDVERTDKQVPDGYIYKLINGRKYYGGLVKVANAAAVQPRIDALGVLVGTRAGDIWTVHVPAEHIKSFTQVAGMSYIQLDEPVRPALAEARKTTRTDSVHMGVGLTWPMTGNGVVLGAIDFGFDYGHPTFYDTLGTGYRVKKVWEMGTTGTPPAGYAYGHELVGDAAIKTQGTDNIEQTHGTAVAGIAAGSGYGAAGAAYRGIAFNADMVFACVRRDSIGDQWRSSSFTDFVDGVNYIFSYGASVSKPTVCNISWGSQSGPHDGTSLTNQAFDNLSGEGKMIVMSAGNDGEENIHISKAFNSAVNDTVVNTFVTFSSNTYKRTWIDIWGDTAKTFCAQVTLYHNGVAGNTTGFYCIDDQVHSTYLLADNGLDTCFIEYITSSSEFNDKPRLTINIFNKAGDSVYVSVKGNDGAIDMWNEYYYYGYKYGFSSVFESLGKPGAVNGNTVTTVSDMGAAKSVLLVGAYASKVNYKDIGGTNRTYGTYVAQGALVPFSSRGPMVDGRIKPDITAPGLTLATATSSFDVRYTPTGLNKASVVAGTNFAGKDYYYAEFLGTSASSPVAAGIVALMFEANPKLKPQQVQDMIAQTAITDVKTGTLPVAGNNNWGHGKINAYGAVKAARQANSVYEYKGKQLDCVLFPNPNNGLFTIGYTADRAGDVRMEVYDISGRLVMVRNWKVQYGENRYMLDMAGRPKGLYTIRLADGQNSVSIKTTIR
jgi:hypothetical protein